MFENLCVEITCKSSLTAKNLIYSLNMGMLSTRNIVGLSEEKPRKSVFSKKKVGKIKLLIEE